MSPSPETVPATPPSSVSEDVRRSLFRLKRPRFTPPKPLPPPPSPANSATMPPPPETAPATPPSSVFGDVRRSLFRLKRPRSTPPKTSPPPSSPAISATMPPPSSVSGDVRRSLQWAAAPPPPLADQGGEAFVEMDPSGRYGRYSDLLGFGAVKKVYRAFDQQEGIEVAWNQVRLGPFDEPMRDRLFTEVHILRSLRHRHIISLRSAWHSATAAASCGRPHTTTACPTLNFITDLCTSGNLRDYRKRHRHVSLKALKNWIRQILSGLNHLHSHNPCIIHRDLNLSNVFMNGNIGEVKIGDLGFAAIVGPSHAAHSIVGTPEFMAPELYEEEYTEMVDIYAFGLCVLEMVTMEIPYRECASLPQIYKKVTTGVRPAVMEKVTDPEVRRFIERCLGSKRNRPSAAELLKDPFFDGIDVEEPSFPIPGRRVPCGVEAGMSGIRI